MALEAEREARKRREEEEERRKYPSGMLSATLLEAKAKALEGRRRREEEEQQKYLSEETLEAESKIFDCKLSKALLVVEARALEAVWRRKEEERWKKLAALPPVTDEKEKKQMFDICVASGLPPSLGWQPLEQQAVFRLFRLFSSSNALSEARHHASVGRPMTSHSHASLIRLALLDPIRAFPSSNIRHCIGHGFSYDTNRPDSEVCGQKAFEAKGRLRDGQKR
ncbi:hypothetical protein OROMI_007825 [Orobanche minor]